MRKGNFLEEKNRKWADKSNKEKLDFVFVIVAIITFSLTAYIHIRSITKEK
jgi:hypothetical protein